MLEHFMTEEKLKAGLTDYLRLYEYDAPETADLFDILDLINYEMRWLLQCVDYSRLGCVQNK